MPQISIQQNDLQQFRQHPPHQRTRYCRALEEGQILFFPQTPFEFPQEEIDFLLAQKQTDASFHKNISYRPSQHVVRGLARESAVDRHRLLEVMGAYSRRVTGFLEELLPPYSSTWRLDYASFRPRQEKGRKLKLKARNDLLHVDAFPTRPTRGDRILRFFTNINPEEPRRWITAEPFDQIVSRFTGRPGLPFPQPSRVRPLLNRITSAAGALGIPVVARSPYDRFMLRFHDYLKADQEFQRDSLKEHWEFPSGSSWMVFTDMVPHAALSGQYALEQTFIISRQSLLLPERAPVNALESICGFAVDR